MEIASFQTFLAERIKVAGKAGALGDVVSVSNDKTKVTAAELAAVPSCGNGGVDFGEDCDCGLAGVDPDGCCNCDTCTLNAGKSCSSVGFEDGGLCCQSSCKLASAGVLCRSAAGECDVPEECTGDSPVCPSDMGEAPSSECTTSQGESSTCYGGSFLRVGEETREWRRTGQMMLFDDSFEHTAYNRGGSPRVVHTAAGKW